MIDHIVLTCPILAEEQYIQRHDRLCAELHLTYARGNRVKLDNEVWYELVTKFVDTSHDGRETVLWKKQVEVNRTRAAVSWLNREQNNKICSGKTTYIFRQDHRLHVAD